jgi:hypothetical protein
MNLFTDKPRSMIRDEEFCGGINILFGVFTLRQKAPGEEVFGGAMNETCARGARIRGFP